MRTLLTGGTGFLGSHIAEGLVAAGHDVVCSVRRTSDTRWIDPLGLETVILDLGADAVPDAIAGIEQVVHCGGLTRARSEVRFLRVNAEGTAALARAAAAAGVRRFVYISSLAARGPEGAGGPISPYGRSKEAGERALATVEGDMERVVLRPGGVYGPRDPDLLPLFKLAAKGWIAIPAGAPVLQPVYVDDLVSVTLAALSSPVPAGPLPVAHPARHGWPALALALAEAVGIDARILKVPPAAFWTVGLLSEVAARFTGTPPAMDRRRARDMSRHRWTADIDETREALGWEPRVDIRQGLTRTAAWYRDQGWL